MNKFGIFLMIVASACSFSSVTATTCQNDISALFKDINFIDMKDECVVATENQIQKEVTAAMKYLSMAAFFSRDDINRPGFAKLFFEAASEEREHAGKLIEYLSMRGRYQNKDDNTPARFSALNIKNLVHNAETANILELPAADITLTKDAKSATGLKALQIALKLEIAVTKSIRNLVQKCESDSTKNKDGSVPATPFNHYHFVDYLTGEFLEEQYKGQRDLAGKISTLGKLVAGNGAELGEFLFDKQLL